MLSSANRHPYIFFMMFFLTNTMFINAQLLFAEQSVTPDFGESLAITESEIHFSLCDQYNSISCMGKIQNSSDSIWEEIVVEVQYFDPENKMIDTITEYLYGTVIPANDTVAFRVVGKADKGEDQYRSHQVRITSATENTPYYPTTRTKKDNALISVLINWTPMIVIIAVWIYFIRKNNGKHSLQRKSMDMGKEQIELIREQNNLFKNLVDVISDHTAKIEKMQK